MKKLAAFSLIVFFVCSLGIKSEAQVGVSVTVAPPPIQITDQPEAPGDGYIWEPGYWAWGANGWYWVNGVWALPTEVGFLWTPGYWSFYGGYYRWHRGYWGDHVGYYGGVNYGFGYGGHGYDGGRWEGGHFRYNTAVSHVNASRVHYVYSDRSVVHAGGSPGASFHTVHPAPSHAAQPIRQATPQRSAQPIRQAAPQRTQPIRQAAPQRSMQHAAPAHAAPMHQEGGGERR